MYTKPQGPAPDITVTTATQTEAQVRENLGVPADAKPVEGEVKPEAVKPEEAEADSPKPDAEVSEAARKLRGSRADERKAKIQREIDDAVKERERVKGETARERAELDRLKREREQSAAPPAKVEPKPQPVAADPAAPKFEFPTYEQWLAQHADSDYDGYQDARTDARYAFNRQAERQAEQREQAIAAQRKIADENTAHVSKFREAHPDYEAKLQSVQIPLRADGSPFPAAIDLNALVMRSGADGPAILYHLANHPEKVDALLKSNDFAELSQSFGELRFVVKAEQNTSAPGPTAVSNPVAVPSPVVVPPPPKPVTDAPAPVSQVPGSAQSTRSLAQLASASDDADAYIEARKKQMKAG